MHVDKTVPSNCNYTRVGYVRGKKKKKKKKKNISTCHGMKATKMTHNQDIERHHQIIKNTEMTDFKAAMLFILQ